MNELRRSNERRFIRALNRRGLLSRADLARTIGVSAVTSSKIIDVLIASGIVDEVRIHVEKRAIGRPPRYCALSQSHLVGAIEVGPNWMRASLVSLRPDKGPLEERTWTHEGTIESALKPIQDCEFLKDPRVHAWVVSLPGIVDESKGRVLFAAHVPWVIGTQFITVLRSMAAVPVLPVQEVKVAALGHRNGSGDDDGSFLFVSLGEGVGGAIVMDGRLMSGEIGYTPIAWQGEESTLETVVNESALLEMWRKTEPSQAQSADQMYAFIRERGLPFFLLPALDAIASTVAGAVNLLGIRQVVLDGPLPHAHSSVVEYVTERVNTLSLWGKFDRVECVASVGSRQQGMASLALDEVILSRFLTLSEDVAPDE